MPNNIKAVRVVASRWLGRVVINCSIRGEGVAASIDTNGVICVEYPNEKSDCEHYSNLPLIRTWLVATKN